jgi:hypothetical protein
MDLNKKEFKLLSDINVNIRMCCDTKSFSINN